MKKLAFVLSFALVAVSCAPTDSASPDIERWETRAAAVTITRDDWGIPHIYGPTDADAVFGMIYAQAEDDFMRIEQNYLLSLGRLAEVEGEDEIWRDLRMKLFIDPVRLQALYAEAPERLRVLFDAWADGLNYFLHTHPEVEPRVIDRFEPWMALSFSEGSIGGDIERVNLRNIEAFYGEGDASAATFEELESERMAIALDPQGSNGISIAPENTVNGNALLLVNPHTSFYFRHELHMRSDEGLNAYGAVTWGQFFIYQGFNENAGWMHTSSGVDNIDEFAQTIVERDGEMFYVYGDEERPVEIREITIPYRTDGGGMAERTFTTYHTHHGPIVREADGRWIATALMNDPLNAYTQSYLRTKANNYDEYVEVMRLHTNSSNNTLFADSEGNIAYFHSNFIPVRDPQFDYLQPVDGSDPATDWQGVHTFEDTPNGLNPPNGWLYNTNNWPFSMAGPEHSPSRDDYPVYMDRWSENPRGVHAMEVLTGKTDFTLDGLIDAAYSSRMPAFDDLVPALVGSFDRAASGATRTKLAGPVDALRRWDRRWGVTSVPTTLAVLWGREMMRVTSGQWNGDLYAYLASGASDATRLEALSAVVDRLERDFGTWETAWGEVNRFQRIANEIVHPFDDDAPSIPVGFTGGRWGSLASYGVRQPEGSRHLWGVSGNSFVAVVEFGERVRAKAVTAGGLSGDPSSPHFNDQAERYATGDLRDVYFYEDELEGHVERTYHPGG